MKILKECNTKKYIMKCNMDAMIKEYWQV